MNETSKKPRLASELNKKPKIKKGSRTFANEKSPKPCRITEALVSLSSSEISKLKKETLLKNNRSRSPLSRKNTLAEKHMFLKRCASNPKITQYAPSECEHQILSDQLRIDKGERGARVKEVSQDGKEKTDIGLLDLKFFLRGQTVTSTEVIFNLLTKYKEMETKLHSFSEMIIEGLNLRKKFGKEINLESAHSIINLFSSSSTRDVSEGFSIENVIGPHVNANQGNKSQMQMFSKRYCSEFKNRKTDKVKAD